MKVFAEKETENFLEKEGFKIVKRTCIKKNEKESQLKEEIKKIGFPLVMKVSGKKIIHKNIIGGVKKDIVNYKQALKAFKNLIKIKNCEGIILQKQIQGKEFLLGIKKTPEFGHVIAFGRGGIYTEKFRDVSFRVCPFDRMEAEKMIKEIKVAKKLNKKEIFPLIKNLIKLCELAKKYSGINELDINPLIVKKDKAIIVDARVFFS